MIGTACTSPEPLGSSIPSAIPLWGPLPEVAQPPCAPQPPLTCSPGLCPSTGEGFKDNPAPPLLAKPPLLLSPNGDADLDWPPRGQAPAPRENPPAEPSGLPSALQPTQSIEALNVFKAERAPEPVRRAEPAPGKPLADRPKTAALPQAQQNVEAFLKVIRVAETDRADKQGGDYKALYGGKHFSGYSAHPGVRAAINVPGYGNTYTTAAGAYQFIDTTWNDLKQRLNLKDFTPASQDRAAIQLLKDAGAYGAIQKGDFEQALAKAAGPWASLPGSSAGQGGISMAFAKKIYKEAGGA